MESLFENRETPKAEDCFAGGGEMGERMRNFDWGQTPLGPVEKWPRSLKTAVRIILNSRYPMFVWWGRQMTKFYNDAYIPILGKRHPEALGQPASLVWAEIWHVLGPQAEAALNEGRASWNEQLLLVMERYGYSEEAYFTFSYSSIVDDDGGIGGVFCACTEDTGLVPGERRLHTTERKQAEENLRERSRQLDLLAQTGRELIFSQNPDTAMLQTIFERVGESIGAELCFNYLLGDEPETLRLAATIGVSDEEREFFSFIRFSEYLCGMVAARRERLIVENMRECESPEAAALCSAGVRCYAGFPLLAHGQLFGTVAFATKRRDYFREGELHMVQAVCDQVAATLERSRLFDRLRESEERLRAMFDATTVGFATLAPDARFVKVNDAFCRIVGYSRSELLQMDCAALTHPDYVESAYKFVAQLIAGEIPLFVIEERYVRKDGAEIWVQNSVSPLRDASGKPLHLIAVCQDITERKQAEEALRGQAELLELAHDAIIVRDINNVVTYWNRGAEEIYGWTREDALGNVTHTLLRTKFPKPLEEISAEFIREGHWEGELTHIRSDGTQIVVASRWALQRDEHDNPAAILEINNNITERKRVEDELQRFKFISDNSTDAHHIFNYEGRFVYGNKTACERLGYTEEEFLRLSVPDIDPLWTEERIRTAFNLPKGRNIQPFESVYRRKDGTVFPVEISATPIEFEGKPHFFVSVRDITKRKTVEDKLRESEEQFRTLAENMSQFAWMADGEGWILWYNRRWFDYTGTTLEEMQGWGWTKVHHPDHVDRVVARIQRSWDTGELWEDTFPLRGKDGNYRWFLSRAMPIHDADGKVVRWFGTNTDVTERLAAEDALRRAHDELETRVQERTAGLALKNRNETIIRTVTQAVHRSINLEEVLDNAAESISENMAKARHVAIYMVEGKDAVIKAHKRHPDRFMRRIERIPYPKGYTWKTIMEGKSRCCADVDTDTVIGPAGKEAGTKSYLSVPIRSGGETVGCISIDSSDKNAFDEDDVKLMEIVSGQIEVAIKNAKQAEALRGSEERFRNLVESTNDWVWEIDKSGVFTYANPKVYEVVGYEPGKILGRTTFDFMTPGEARRFAEVIGPFISEKQPFARLEKTLIHKDGRPVILETSGSPMFDDKGVFQGYRGMARDVTDRKRTEDERLRLDKLESIGVLAGGIAHDFNNLLTSIMITISLVKMNTSPGTDAYENLAEAEEVCYQAKKLTQQLLTFSRGGMPVKKLVSLERVITESSKFALRGSNVKCDFNIDNDLWNVNADEGQVSQVISNLVINADQAMPQGGVIRARAENIINPPSVGAGLKPAPTKDGKYVKITVEDEGMGIPKEHLTKIFDPYFSTKQKGSGLGLTTVHSIIKNHGGYIEAESEMGMGTKFYVYLPASPEKAERKSRAKTKGMEKKKMGAKTKGRVLIMDDEAIVRIAAGRALNDIGYEVEHARDGSEAIELYERAREGRRSFDVVIMDLTVPGGMGGKEAMEKLIEIDSKVKAIVSSGYSDDPVMSEFHKYGFKGVVCKPYDVDELSDMLRTVIGKR